MRIIAALIGLMGVVFLLYTTSQFSRDRANPSWSSAGREAASNAGSAAFARSTSAEARAEKPQGPAEQVRAPIGAEEKPASQSGRVSATATSIPADPIVTGSLPRAPEVAPIRTSADVALPAAPRRSARREARRSRGTEGRAARCGSRGCLGSTPVASRPSPSPLLREPIQFRLAERG
jgi:hypothetical protein